MAALRRALASRPEVPHRELERMSHVVPVLQDFARREIDTVVIDGGDGTVQEVVSAILNRGMFERAPALALLPTGRTNLIAGDVGLRGRPDRAVARLLDAGTQVRRLARPALSLSHEDWAAPEHGFFFGTAALYRATEWGRANVHPFGAEQSLAVVLSGALFAARFVRGSRSGQGYAGDPIAVAADGRFVSEGGHFLFLATTLQRLLLGVYPFWGPGAGMMRYVAVRHPPRRLGRALPALLRGRPRPWMEEAGYLSGKADEISLQLSCPVVLDGEIFEPGSGGRFTLRSSATIEFVQC